MKHVWKKHEKGFNGANQIPAVVIVPMQNYIMIDGKGNPNNADISREVHDFSVYPLERVWKQKQGDDLVKDELEYTIMIRQPDFITESMVCKAMEAVKKKKPNPLYEEICFDTMQDGKCIEILHIGAFDDEPAFFEKMTQFAKKTIWNATKAVTGKSI